MLRSFLPVGQGAFYRETFNLKNGRHTIIYDCGSLTDRSIVEQQIKDEFKSGDEIDAVFISHLDEDHINGLPFLIKYCKVRNLFFPLITTRDKVCLKLKALLSVDKDSFLYMFIDNPIDAIDSLGVNYVLNLYPIKAVSGENLNNDSRSISSGRDVVKEEKLIFDEKIDWNLIPFNFRQEERIEEFKNAISEIFICEADKTDGVIEDLINNYPKDKDKIKEAYKRVKGTFNTNSMTLFSGTKNSYIGQHYAIPKHCYCACRCKLFTKNGCLYMGDYDASGTQKWKAIRDKYNEFWKYIGCIQIPHHGSQHNYNNKIAELNVISVISAGSKNRYHHPHSSVIKDLILNDCLVHIVTENVGSRVDLKVDLF